MGRQTLKVADLKSTDCYKLLTAIIVPRPIALVSSVSEAGLVNAAPYSFFNMFAEAPPTIVLGLHWRPDTTLKDTTANIAKTGEFVVNLVDEDLAQAMSDTAIDFPPEVSETEALGLALAPSIMIKPPRLAAAPFALECRKTVSLSFTAEREILLGEILCIHAREGLVDPKRLYVDFEKYRPVGRLHGNLYARQRDIFELKRPSYADWAKGRKE
jgi:flavin reductase (DIM6/NTAB) family NADH-FMN oxidoreductase RutF